MGRGEPNARPQSEGHFRALARAFISGFHDFEQVRSGSTDPHFCARDVHLHRGPFGKDARASRRSLGGRQLCELVDCGAGQAERHSTHADGQQTEDGKVVERTRLARAIGQERDGALLWNEQVADLDVMAPGTAQSDHPPGVMDVRLGSREDHHSGVRDSALARPRDAIVFDRASTHQPRAMLATTREGPAARHAIPAGYDDRPAGGSEHAAGHRLGRTGEDFVGRCLVQPSRDEPAGCPDHHAPRRSRVPQRELFDHTNERCRRRLFALERSGDTQREKTCRGEFRDDIKGEPPLALDPWERVRRRGTKARAASIGSDAVAAAELIHQPAAGVRA